MSLKGTGKRSVLGSMSKKMLLWVKQVSEGADPYLTAKYCYPDNPDYAVLVEELYSHPKVKQALNILVSQSLRTRLLKIIADPDSKDAAILMAAKQLERLDNPPERESDKKEAKPFLVRPGEDTDLDAKLLELGNKAKAG